jgi:hypothetical protein
MRLWRLKGSWLTAIRSAVPARTSACPPDDGLGLGGGTAAMAEAPGAMDHRRRNSPREAAESPAIREGTVRVHPKAIFRR